MTLVDVLRLIRRSWKALVITTLLGIALMAGYTALQPVVYSSTSTGYLVAGQATGNVFDAQNNQTFAAQRAQQYVPLANSSAVMDRMGAHLEGSNVSPGPVSVSIIESSNIMSVSATGSTPEESQARADAGVKAMADVIQRLETVNPAQAINSANEGEMGSLDQLETSGQSAIALVTLEPAVAPVNPISPNWPRNLALGAVGGLFAGVLIAFARRFLDARVRTKDDIERITSASVLAVVPQDDDLERLHKKRQKSGVVDSSGLAFESLRKLRTNLRFVSIDDPPRAIVITSPNPAEGKSTVTSNLGRVLAQAGQRVLVIDADLRRPMQGKEFGLDQKVGLTQVLTGDVRVEDAIQNSDTTNLFVLTAGRIPPNPSEVTGSQQMADLIEQLKQEYFVLIDAPPLLPVTDAGLLSGAADGTLLVVRVGKTYKDQVEIAVNTIDQVKGKLLGTVLNGATRKNMGEVMYGYGKGYGYGQSYYYAYEEGNKRRKKARGESAEQVAAQVASDSQRLAPFKPTEGSRAQAEQPVAAPVTAEAAAKPARAQRAPLDDADFSRPEG